MPYFTPSTDNFIEAVSKQHTSDRMAGIPIPIPMSHQRMSLILPLNTLPSDTLASNVPSLPQLEEYVVPGGMLLGRCSNSQNESELDLGHPKSEQLSPAETVLVNDIRRGKYPNVRHKTAEDIIREANRLWRQLLRCRAYSKYRERKPKGTPSAQDMKWPEHMEIAFCQALIIYPPVGRRKVASGDSTKARGRNELIADFIQRYTGEPRSRKQVSSHIQVLKPMVKDDPFLTNHLTVTDHKVCGRNHQRNCHDASRRAFSRSAYTTPEDSTPPTRYPSHNSFPWHHGCMLTGSSLPPLYTNAISPKVITKAPIKFHEPLRFEMFIRDSSHDGASVPLHIFTAFRRPASCLGNLQISEPTQLRTHLPMLSSIPSYEDISSTQIILVESSLRLVSDALPNGAELGIQFELKSSCNLSIYNDFSCTTRFFQDGRQICDDINGSIEYDTQYKRMGNVQFGSDFWARKVIETAQHLRKAVDLRRKGAKLRTSGLEVDMRELAKSMEEEAEEVEQEVRKLVQRLTGLQEITARCKATGDKKRLLLVCWKFEQAASEETGETTWKNVILRQGPQLQCQVGHIQQFQPPLFQQDIFRQNHHSFEPGSMDRSSSLAHEHLQQRRHSFNPDQQQHPFFGPLAVSNVSMNNINISDLNEAAMAYPLPHDMGFSGEQMRMSFDSPYNKPYTTSTTSSHDGSPTSYDVSAHNISPYTQMGPWTYAFHGSTYHNTEHYCPNIGEDDAQSHIYSQPHSHFESGSHSFVQQPQHQHLSGSSCLDENQRHHSVAIAATSFPPDVNTNVHDSTTPNIVANTPTSYTPSPYIPSFSEESQRRGSHFPPSNENGLRRSSLATSFTMESQEGGQLTPISSYTPVSAGPFGERRRGSIEF